MSGLGDLIFQDGSDNMGGTQLIAEYCSIDDIETMPGFVEAPATLAEFGKIPGDVVLKAGKAMHKLYATPDTGKVDDNKVEGNDVNTYESVYEFRFPDPSAPEAIGFSRLVGTSKLFVRVLENSGRTRGLGTKTGCPCVVGTVSGTTSTMSSGEKGITYQFKSYQNGPAPVMEGSVTVAGA